MRTAAQDGILTASSRVGKTVHELRTGRRARGHDAETTDVALTPTNIVESRPVDRLLRDAQEASEVGQMARAEVATRGFTAPTVHEGVRDASSEVLSSEEDKAQGHFWHARRSSREEEESLGQFRGTGVVRATASRLSGSG